MNTPIRHDALTPPPIKFKSVDRARFYEMLNILPPLCDGPHGFMVSEPIRDRVCAITGQDRAVYAAFIHYREGYYESSDPMTVPEFRALIADSRAFPALIETA